MEKALYTGAYAGGGALGARAPPHPPPGKKVPLRNVQKRRESSAQICRQKRMHILLRCDKIKTKKVGKNKKIVKKKGLKIKK